MLSFAPFNSFIIALVYSFMKPFHDPLTNGLANGANWQIFSTFFVAFVILADPFEMDTSVLAIFLVFMTVIFVLHLFCRSNLRMLTENSSASIYFPQ